MLYRNDVFEFVSDGRRGRLLAVDPVRNEAWVISLESETAFPILFMWSDIQAQVDSGAIKRIESGLSKPVANSVSEAARTRRDAAWARLEPLISLPGIFIPDERSRLVQARAKELGCSIYTLYKDLRSYWRGGQTRDALIPRFHECGRSAKSLTGGRGRRPTKIKYPIFQLQEQDTENIKAAINKYYLSGEVQTMDSAYQTMLEERYCFLDGNGNVFILPKGECPSLRQFQNILNTLFSDETKIRKRKGDKSFEQNNRARTGADFAERDR